MNYKIENKRIVIIMLASNNGKFRFKTRKNNLDFGEIIATRTDAFDEKTYLEWQIGYDAIVADVDAGKKTTQLNKLSFIGNNKKVKFPYELSELLYSAIKIGIISVDKIKTLLNDIGTYSNFISDRKIDVEHLKKTEINGLPFEETSIRLPTFYMLKTSDNTQIEVSIQKQQYASGVQPMLYFCIPINSFANGSKLMGRSSTIDDEVIYVIDSKNTDVLFDMTKIFAMCSKSHNFDITEILKTLIKLIKNESA